MLRRIAGNCFWLGRYLERADAVARLSLAAQECAAARGPAEVWRDALAIASCLASYRAANAAVAPEQAAGWLLLEGTNPSSAVSCLRAVGANARSARDLLGDAYWEAVNVAWIEADALSRADLASRGVSELAAWVQLRCRTIRGAAEELERGEPLHAIAAGTASERCDFALRLLATLMPDPQGGEDGARGAHGADQVRDFILGAAAARDHFQRLPRSESADAALWHLLAADAASPRSLLSSLDRLQDALDSLHGGYASPALAEVAALRARVGRWRWEPPGPTRAAELGEIHLSLCATTAAIEREQFQPTPPPPAAQADAQTQRQQEG